MSVFERSLTPVSFMVEGSSKAKPRLLVLASTYPRWDGDTEPGFVHELCRRLTEHFDVRVVCPHAPGAMTKETMDGVEVRRFRYAPARWQRLTNNGGIMANLKHRPWRWLLLPGFMLGMSVAAFGHVRRWRPTAVHAHWLIPQGLAVAALSFLVSGFPPFMVTSHGGDLFALRRWPFASLKRFVAHRAAALSVVSAGMVEELDRLGISATEVSVQPMGVDLQDRFTPDKQVKRSGTELLFVGRLVEKKGLRYLLKALPRLQSKHPEAHLTIAGFGPDEAALRAQVKQLGLQDRVRFLGAQPQHKLPDLYRRAAVFIAPFVEAESGDQEGLGLVTVEAIGCGCPAIVTDIPATRDVIRQDEFRVEPRSPEALAMSISRVLAMSPGGRESLAALQREAVERAFDWSNRADAYARLLLRLDPGV